MKLKTILILVLFLFLVSSVTASERYYNPCCADLGYLCIAYGVEYHKDNDTCTQGIGIFKLERLEELRQMSIKR